ncbi:pilus assembly PilX family protein [Ideonella sp. YS5]|uniref:pilus assembly PilX family protein n=1 Tax=Ideonella sp. YS5 TaxID=3453714 RepID=UPI003EEA90E9
MRSISRSSRRGQGGIIMVVTLIALAVLLLGGVALMRSSDTSSALAGQIGFRRDLKNQGERAMSMAITSLKSGALSAATTRLTSLASSNYSAVQLEANDNGIPKVLLKSDSDFKAAGYTVNIVDADSSEANATSGVKARYVIDRLCLATGTTDAASCSKTDVVVQNNGQDSNSQKADTSFRSINLVVYRISVRVDGPRGTQAFFQSTVAR